MFEMTVLAIIHQPRYTTPMSWEKYRYHIRETVRIVGIRKLLFRFLLVALALYIFLPDFSEPPPELPAAAVQPEQTVPPLTGELSDTDLRKLMTTHQSAFYWTTFQWMMEYGKPLEPRNFNDPVIHLAYLADEKFMSGRTTCRPYSEKLVLAKKMNIRKGIACRSAQGGWCRQPEGEKAICRIEKPGGIAGLQVDAEITMHAFKIGWDRNLAKLPF